MKFLPLFRLRVKHTYYTNGRCQDFYIKPATDTEKLIKNQRCVLKPQSDGAELFIAVNSDDTPFIQLPDTAVFHFYLYLKNPDFFLFTDLTQIEETPAPLFTNTAPDSEGVTSLTLISSASKPSPSKHTSVFAEVLISYSSLQTDSTPIFEVNFVAKQARWRYYVIADHSSAEFQIQDSATELLLFSEANRTHLNQQPDSKDAIAQRLIGQYPNKQYYRFLSDNLITCQQQPRKSLQLHLNGNQIVNTLPTPSLQSSIWAEGVQNETTLFEVVKYFTHE